MQCTCGFGGGGWARQGGPWRAWARVVGGSLVWYNIGMAEREIPDYVRPFLWSYDTDQLSVEHDRALIIKNVLDYGTKQATDWLRATYSREDIQDVIVHTPTSAWNKKSLALWTLLYDVAPERSTRFA